MCKITGRQCWIYNFTKKLCGCVKNIRDFMILQFYLSTYILYILIFILHLKYCELLLWLLYIESVLNQFSIHNAKKNKHIPKKSKRSKFSTSLSFFTLSGLLIGPS